MGKATGYYRDAVCAPWLGTRRRIRSFSARTSCWRETDEAAQRAMEAHPGAAAVSAAGRCRQTRCWNSTPATSRARRGPASVNRALPINFVGGPDTVVEQIKRCREETGAGIIDLGFQTPGSSDPDLLMAALELFGNKVLPHIRDI